MASQINCLVHPVVVLSIADAYERRSLKEGAKTKAIGTLLGHYEKNGVQVTNCYPVPFSDTHEDVQLDQHHNLSYLENLRKAVPHEVPVGWFTTDAELTEHCMNFHDYYSDLIQNFNQQQLCKREPLPVLLLTVDAACRSAVDRMPIKAFVRTKAGVPTSQEPHCAIFNPIKVELSCFEAEEVALDLLNQMTDPNNKTREIQLETGIDQLNRYTEEMNEWIHIIRQYVDDVLDGKRDGDGQVGRRLMELVNSVSANFQPKKFHELLNSSMRDYLMVSYLGQLAKSQLALNEKLVGM